MRYQFSPNSRFFAVLGIDGWIVVWDVVTREEIFRWDDQGKLGVGVVSFTPDGDSLIAGGWERPPEILNLPKLRRQLAEIGLNW